MSNVEKQMNRDDLLAWKQYDNNQYSMIPGISHQKKIADGSGKKASPIPKSSKALTLDQE